MLVELLHEWIGVEVFHVPYAGLLPQTLGKHHGAYHGRYAGGIAYALHAGLLISRLMAAVVIDVVGLLLAVLDAAYATADGCLALIVLAEVLRIRQHGLEELQGYDVHLYGLAGTVGKGSLVGHLVNA